jgi:hypothetical protein
MISAILAQNTGGVKKQPIEFFENTPVNTSNEKSKYISRINT